MKLKKNIATSEEGFLYNPGTGDSFTTNPIGTDIISMLREEKPSGEIIEMISLKYDVDKQQFEKDLEDYIAQLKDFNMLD